MTDMQGIGGAMAARLRRLATCLAVAAALAGCAGEIGPVDHSCHLNPYDSQGSGCEHNQFRGAWRPGHG